MPLSGGQTVRITSIPDKSNIYFFLHIYMD